jgi:hypothetical protein
MKRTLKQYWFIEKSSSNAVGITAYHYKLAEKAIKEIELIYGGCWRYDHCDHL